MGVFSIADTDLGENSRFWMIAKLGGFPDWPILEDVELVKRLRRTGRVIITPEAAPTSARRWQQCGVLRTWARHQLILTGYALGIPPHRLARLR